MISSLGPFTVSDETELTSSTPIKNSGEGETKVEDALVKVYGNAAVYTATIIDRSRNPDGTTSIAKTCVTDVFIQRNRRWKMVASHESLIESQ